MRLFLSLILPTIIILLPCILFVVFRLIIKTKILVNILIAGVLLFIVGFFVPWIALGISIKGLMMGMPEGGCVTGATVFCFFGYAINLIGIPMLGLIFFILEKVKKR
ncbi:MAG: hypothetical protein H6Q20_1946 [Bacteroidetes bacterium]|nr:hypothetical protein [Bacteroidota bacterium]